MSSLTSSNDRCKVFGAMVLAGFFALCLGSERANCQPIASANGNQAFVTTPLILTTGSESAAINVASVAGTSGLYDVNGVLTMSNAGAAQTVTAQYFVNNVATGPLVTTVVPANATSTTIAVPQQLVTTQPNATVSLHLNNTTGTAAVTVGNGSGVTVTGYTSNLPPAASAPGSANLATTLLTPPTNVPLPGLTVTVPAVASAQGLYSLNSSLFINATSGATQLITAQYTVDNALKGAAFQVSLPGSGSTMLALPSQLTGLGAGTHTIGIQVSGASGLFSVGAGSSLSATSYNAASGVNSTTAAQVNNAGIGFQSASLNASFIPQAQNPPGAFFVTVPVNGTPASFYDANAVLMFSGTAQQTLPVTISAQYLINGTVANSFTDGTLTGPTFTTVLAAGANSVATLYMPEQFAALTSGKTLAVMLTVNGATDWNIDADSLTLIAHNNVPNAATPEPASMSLAAMAMMAFGAAAYRKRKAGRVQA